MSDEAGEAAGEVAEIENDGIVLDAAARVQCSKCGTVVAARYQLGEEAPDPDLIPEGKAVCPVCTKRNGVRTVILCGFPAGEQYAAVEQAIEIAGEVVSDDDDDDDDSAEGESEGEGDDSEEHAE